MQKKRETSWNGVSKWYNKLTEDGGHYYHTHVVIPGVLKLLNLSSQSRLVDIACGSGVLARHIPPSTNYLGIDKAANLIREAQKQDSSPHHTYAVADATLPYQFARPATHATIILALQNMQHPEGAIANAASALELGGTLVIVLNHPMFRIPRQSGWKTDEATKAQYRTVTRYMSPLEIPITAHPGQRSSAVTWSYHLPLSAYSSLLHANGFAIDLIDEWVSDKTSVGKAGKQENRARQEIPLFMAIQARRTT